METGWIKIHRKLRKKSYYNKSHYVHLWVELLLLASHGDTEFMWNGKTQKLNKGQFVTGRKQLSESTGIPETSVERLLTFYEKDRQIGQQKNNKFRLITILNWESYQQNGQQADNKRTTDGHIQECKNVKKVKKDTAQSAEEESKFNLQEAIKSLEDSPRRDHNIIALYWTKAKLTFPSKTASHQDLRMCLAHIKQADLGAYTNSQLINTMDYLMKTADYPWNLATVGKLIKRDLTKLKSGKN